MLKATTSATIVKGWTFVRVARSRAASLFHRYGYPLLALTRRDLARTYGRAILGRGWMVLQPALLLALYVLVFGFILRVRVGPNTGPGDFALYLMSGMLPYLALADGIQRASTSLSDNRSLLNQAVFPAEVMPFAGVLGASFTELLGLLVVIAVELVMRGRLTGWILLLPVLVLLRIALTLGLSCLVSVLTLFIPDLREVLGFLLTMWLFLTPIFYTPESVPSALRFCLELNPLHHLVSAYRAALLGAPGGAAALLKAGVGTGCVLVFGVWFFRKTVTRARDLL